jgi:intracellular septation protein A
MSGKGDFLKVFLSVVKMSVKSVFVASSVIFKPFRMSYIKRDVHLEDDMWNLLKYKTKL